MICVQVFNADPNQKMITSTRSAKFNIKFMDR